MIYDDVVHVIGNTPTVRINKLVSDIKHRVYLKIEGFNPSSSVKDRPAAYIINQAEHHQFLQPGGTIVESTSGNFGKALAMIGAARGYRVILVVDQKIPKPTLAYCRALGAEIEMVTQPDESGSFQKTRLRRVQEIMKVTPNAFWPNQYANPNNPLAHSISTAQEILNDFNHLDCVVVSVSTGGHISGIARVLKKLRPHIQVLAVDAVGSSIFELSSHAPYLMNGIGLSWRPELLQTEYIDYVLLVSDSEAFSTCRFVATNEGLLLGGSSGAVLFACLAMLENGSSEQTILGIAPDSGTNYLDELFNDDWTNDHGVKLIQDKGRLIAAAKDATSRIMRLS